MNREYIAIIKKGILTVVWLFVTGLLAFPQIKRSYAISLQTDNDSYLMQGQDQYYTNGLFLTFDKPLRHSAAGVDLLTVQIGHQLFNGKYMAGRNNLDWDRPSTGCFFLNASFQRSYAKEWLWNVKGEIGTLGEAGKGKQIQRFIHKTFAMYEVESWESSLKSAVGLDFEASVLKKFWRNKADRFEISGGLTGRGGMNFSHVSTQITFRAGRLAPYLSSNFIGNGGFDSDDIEYYFFFSPSYIYQFYNATIQGALFADQKEERYPISNHVVGQKVGFAYSKSRFSIETALLFNTKEGKDMVQNHQYGRLTAGFRF